MYIGGIVAARGCYCTEVDACSLAAGGRLQVGFDSFIQQPARRVPQPVEIVNVVATLPGAQAESAKRIYVVSGHYDSMPGDVMDPKSPAPGANDDASGVAAGREMACRIAVHPYYPT